MSSPSISMQDTSSIPRNYHSFLDIEDSSMRRESQSSTTNGHRKYHDTTIPITPHHGNGDSSFLPITDRDRDRDRDSIDRSPSSTLRSRRRQQLCLCCFILLLLLSCLGIGLLFGFMWPSQPELYNGSSSSSSSSTGIPFLTSYAYR